MERIITFASGKGGTGKTSVVANLGVAMAQRGHGVVILDADVAMSDLGLMLGLEGQKITLHEVLAGEARLSKAIVQGPGGVKVVPSGVSLNGIRKANLDRLREVVEELAKKSKFLLIDAPPGLDRDAITALKVGKEVVLVTTPDIASLTNAFRAKMIAEQLGVKPIGVVINMATGTKLDLREEEILSMLELPLLARIPEDPGVRRSAASGEPIVIRHPRSPVSRAFKKLASKLAKATPAG